MLMLACQERLLVGSRIDGLSSDQTTTQHARWVIAAIALFVCPL